jgi:hypothetical protein
VTSGFDGNAVIEKDWDILTQFRFWLGVRNRDSGSVCLQEKSRGDSGFTEAYDEDALVGQVH